MAKKTSAKKVAAGVGITTAIAAAALGAYFLYGTEKGQKQRKKMSAWVVKMKKEMTNQLAKMKEVNEEAYMKIIDNVSKRYANLKDVDPAELARMARQLKSHWKNIQKEFKAGGRTVKKMAGKTKEVAKTIRKAKTSSRKKK